MSEWQPIDTAPKDGTSVLLFAREICAGSWVESRKWWVAGGTEDNLYYAPTHWMPLPSAPADEEQR